MVGWSVGLWPVAVACSFDVPFDVLAFDDVGIGSGSPAGEESGYQLVDGVAPESVAEGRFVRGERRPFGRWIVA